MTRPFELAGAMEMEEKLPDGDANCDLHGEQLLMAERLAAARPASSSTSVADLFTKGSHNINLTIIYMVQNVYNPGKSQKTI